MKFTSFYRLLSVLALSAGVAVATTGCATVPKPEAMIPTSSVIGTHHPQSASVVVAGSSATSSPGTSRISNDALQQAIIAAIEKNKTFSSVAKDAGGDYRLAVTVVSMDQPYFGFSFTVKMEAAWSLKGADGTVVMQESVQSEGTAGATEAFAGVERLRLATEAAARNNIAAGLTKIGSLNLASSTLQTISTVAPPRDTAAPVTKALPSINDKVPFLSDRRQSLFREYNRSSDYPKACAISDNGHFSCTGGTNPKDHSLPTDPKERALKTCANLASKPCVLYAVNDEVIYRADQAEPTEATAGPAKGLRP
jgi:hypothetical protein